MKIRMRRTFKIGIIFLLIVTTGLFSCIKESPKDFTRPNIVYILADDMGPGDVSAINGNAAWKTLNIDRIADEGKTFTDAHSGSAVCSPTRYGILTGRYAWRSSLKSGVLWSWDKELIEDGRITVASLLKENGYKTACIGKWHLGLGWQYVKEYPDSVDFSRKILNGPTTRGFDYFYGITASLDIPPYVYIEDDKVTALPDRFTQDTSKFGWWRLGATGSDFEHDQVLPHLTQKVVNFIQLQKSTKNDQPFFIYFALPAPHTPILPTRRFKGKSGTNPYGDFVLRVDHTVGQVYKALEEAGFSDNTVLIFTSDNGCSPQADYEQLAEFGHNPSLVYRGHKADIYEGGHRVPFVASWPGKIPAAAISNQTICLTDLIATCADIINVDLPENAGEDSYSLLPLLLEEPEMIIRESTIHHSVNGSFAIRKGKWKLIMCPGSGGWSYPIPKVAQELNLPLVQLYDLDSDVGETNNIAEKYPEVVNELKNLLNADILSGRSTPGENQENVPSDNWPGVSWMK